MFITPVDLPVAVQRLGICVQSGSTGQTPGGTLLRLHAFPIRIIDIQNGLGRWSSHQGGHHREKILYPCPFHRSVRGVEALRLLSPLTPIITVIDITTTTPTASITAIIISTSITIPASITAEIAVNGARVGSIYQGGISLPGDHPIGKAVYGNRKPQSSGRKFRILYPAIPRGSGPRDLLSTEKREEKVPLVGGPPALLLLLAALSGDATVRSPPAIRGRLYHRRGSQRAPQR